MKIISIAIAAALAASPTVASAGVTVTLDLDRMLVLREAAVNICPRALDMSGDTAENTLRLARPLHLDEVEQLYLLNLCILYVEGRQDEQTNGRSI